MNDKMYPMFVLISCSFLDSYIQNNLHEYAVMLPGNLKYGTRNIYMNQVHDEFADMLDAITEDITKISEELNNNDMSKLKDMYKSFKEKTDNVVKKNKKTIEDSAMKKAERDGIEIDFTSNKQLEDYLNSTVYNDYLSKELFLKFTKDFIVDTYIKPRLEKHNLNNHNTLNFVIDDSTLICIDRTRGILRRSDNINMSPMHLAYLTSSSVDLFNSYNNRNTSKTNRIFVIDVHILFLVKNRPFMVLSNVNKKTIYDGKIHIAPSDVMVDIVSNDTPNDIPFEEYDDWDDDDDDLFNDDDEDDDL